MIFVTVGGQKPFDRLVACVDAWVGAKIAAGEDVPEVFAQIGKSERPPQHVPWVESLSPSDYAARVKSASVIVAHAGMGTILTAAELAKPILVLPRLARLGEHRNDHQIATADRMEQVMNLPVARDEAELRDWLERLSELSAERREGAGTRDRLVACVRDFIDGRR